MYRTTTVSELRSDLASLLTRLEEGPIMVLSRSRPAAVLVEPDVFEAILERLELLEDIVEGRKAVSEYRRDRNVAVEAEEVFSSLGM
ncbi:MAG: hypothetical protein A2Z66_08620 [Chloroflexi bacterium RBG_13_66_10]|nr:MAG: hypothetical protein A2Z66_08620 [Chloroflexi bacterium RBG_13_66_10]